MAENSAIEWTDATFNPWIGCTKVSPACDHCYAARQDAHRKWTPEGWGGPRRRTSEALWKGPEKWDAQPFAECMGCGWRGEVREGVLRDSPAGFDRDPGAVRCCPHCREPLLKEARRRVFCASLADVFDNQVPDEWRRDLFDLIANTPNLDWLLLTKRIGNAEAMMRRALQDDGPDFPWANVWLGATVVTQEEADRDVPKLLAVPARVRFLSVEPMLGPVDLSRWLWQCCGDMQPGNDRGVLGQEPERCCGNPEPLDAVHWVIAGGESGPGARPMHPDWACSLRGQCAAAGVPYLHKQNGEWCDWTKNGVPGLWMHSDGRTVQSAETAARLGGVWTGMHRPGKKAAGRLLDGVEHNGFPA